MNREGGPALDATGKIVPRADTPVGSDPASNGSNAMAVAPARSTDGATRLGVELAPAVDRRRRLVRAGRP